MPKLTRSLETTLTQAAAFDYVADWSRQAEWDPNTVSAVRIGEGGPAVDARYELQVRMGPRTVPMTYRITELDAPSRLVLVGKGSGITATDVITFASGPGGTRVDYEAEIELDGLLGLVSPLLGRAFDSIAEGAVSGLKRELDAQAAASASGDA